MTRPDIPSDADLHIERLVNLAVTHQTPGWKDRILALPVHDIETLMAAMVAMHGLMLSIAVRLEAGK